MLLSGLGLGYVWVRVRVINQVWFSYKLWVGGVLGLGLVVIRVTDLAFFFFLREVEQGGGIGGCNRAVWPPPTKEFAKVMVSLLYVGISIDLEVDQIPVDQM